VLLAAYFSVHVGGECITRWISLCRGRNARVSLAHSQVPNCARRSGSPAAAPTHQGGFWFIWQRHICTAGSLPQKRQVRPAALVMQAPPWQQRTSAVPTACAALNALPSCSSMPQISPDHKTLLSCGQHAAAALPDPARATGSHSFSPLTAPTPCAHRPAVTKTSANVTLEGDSALWAGKSERAAPARIVRAWPPARAAQQEQQRGPHRSRITPSEMGPRPPSADTGAFRKPCAPRRGSGHAADLGMTSGPAHAVEHALFAVVQHRMQQADAERRARGAGAHPDQRRLIVQALHAAVADLQHGHLLRV